MRMNKWIIQCIALFLVGNAWVFASEGMSSSGGTFSDSYRALGAALGLGIAVLGGALAQGKTASSALEAIGRNPSAQNKILIPMMIALALIESLVLYAFVIAFIKM